MSQVGSKLRRISGASYSGLAHWCPACEEAHVFALDGKNASGAQWSWDGNIELPTFSPSMHIKTNAPDHPHYQPDVASSVCHYFLRVGVLQYLGDCTHAMKGQLVPLPRLPEHLRN